MAKNAIEHGIVIAENIRRSLEGQSMKPRKPELGIVTMSISMGLVKGISIRHGVATASNVVEQKDRLERAIIAELVGGRGAGR